MSNYVKSKKEMLFPFLDSLKQVNNVIDEASTATRDKSRIISQSAISEVLAGALGVGAGGVASFVALFFGGPVVGLSAAGIVNRTDLRFMARIKREFVEKELDGRLQAELDWIKKLYHNL